MSVQAAIVDERPRLSMSERLAMSVLLAALIMVVAITAILWPLVAIIIGYWQQKKFTAQPTEIWEIAAWAGSGCVGILYVATAWWLYASLPILVTALLLLPYVAGIAGVIAFFIIFMMVLSSADDLYRDG